MCSVTSMVCKSIRVVTGVCVFKSRLGYQLLS